ncbi:MAG TPA: right-handed parallel beta-helix repeat-containing protein [Candidatus Limnocylindrales bacterium]|nr:right-handed parallel beta-helix repeat-containing protein [Candidatus Limnocylindrales bacterium]
MRRSVVLAGVALVAGALAAPVSVDAATTVVACSSGGNLQAAIDAARPGDVLIVRGTCTGTFVVDKDLTLQGRSGATLDGRGAGVTLTVPEGPDRTPGATVAVSGMRIVGGDPAGITNYGDLTVANSTVTANTGAGVKALVVPNPNGAYDFGSVTIRDSSVSRNVGYGISNGWAAVTIEGSSVSHNTDHGVFSGSQGSVAIVSTRIAGNGGDGVYAGTQAGISIDHTTVTANAGVGIFNGNSAVSVRNSTVSYNRAGGVAARDLAYLWMSHDRVTGNAAENGAGIFVYAHDETRVHIDDVTISGNRARTHGGGLYLGAGVPGTFSGLVITKNSAGVSGGGIYREPGSQTALTNLALSGNRPDNCDGC